MTRSTVRRLALLVLLGATGGCDLILHIPDLGDPGNVADMKGRFKAAAQAGQPGTTPLDWGPGDTAIWKRYLGPQVAVFCGRPVRGTGAGATYEVDFSRGSFGQIVQHDIATPLHPREVDGNDFCRYPPENVSPGTE